MKNWQFITIIILIVVWFSILYYQYKEIINNQGFYYDLIISNSNLTLDKVNEIDSKTEYIESMEDAIREKVYDL
jgi:hypothetical protein